ncbi:MAG: hypothetical protein QW279_13495 [Candidatus Jordarchaeaceae archaeon]
MKKLEKIGKINIIPYMQNSLLYPLRRNLLNNKEFLLRYLLLSAILDQQADSASAKTTVIQIYRNYGPKFFLSPSQYVRRFYSAISFASQHYAPKARVMRMKTEGFLILRIGGFLLSLINIRDQYGSLLHYFNKAPSPKDLLDQILNDVLLKGLLYEKAARMYTGWISHPNLWINISSGKWRVHELPMAVDGHVCKVLARSGFLPDVLVENTKTMIVKAENERDRIENEVSNVYPTADRFMIDFGTFYTGITYCKEQKPACAKCPIKGVCNKNTKFKAY